MFKFINYFRKDIKKNSIIVFVSLIFVTGLILIVGATYAAGTYQIVFNRAEGNEIMKTCTTDANGKLDEDCITTIGTVCSKWSLDLYQYPGYVQSGQIEVSEFANMTFSKDTNYYCVAMSSGDYNMGCYVCNSDNNIMHWAANGNANDNCPAGYFKSTTITEEENCKTIVPDSCYVCNNDSNIMKWDNNGNSDSNCSSGYSPIDKPRNECKTIVPDSCYVCNNDSNIMKWDNNGNSDSNCSSGYKAVSLPKNQCKTITNPPTGEVVIALIWFFGFGCLGYSIHYYRNIKKDL